MKGRKIKKECNLRQIGNMALIVGVFAIFLVGICFVRFSKAYVNAFIGNYTGIEEVLATMKGGAATDAAKRELLACQNDYDAWKEQHQGERVTLQTEDNIRLSGLLYDQGGAKRQWSICTILAVLQEKISTMRHGTGRRAITF